MKKISLLILFSVCCLQGCVPAFLAGAAVGGAAIYERKTLQTFTEDLNIHDIISNQIDRIANNYPSSHISVSVFNHVVLLTGQVPNSQMRDQVEQIARNTRLVSRVYNEISINGPTSALVRSSDTWITTKVKGAMLGISGLKSNQFKVVTENGVVYLMGVVSMNQANLAVDAARRVSGVQKVVKVFEYTD